MKKKITLVIIVIAILWGIRIIDIILPLNLNNLGIVPRSLVGLRGILFAPFLHGGFAHLISNTIPLFILMMTMLIFYEKTAIHVFVFSALVGGAFVWIFARSATHIGASGVIFSLVGYILASGVFRKNFKSILIALIIFFIYGGIIWGVLPTRPGISWEGHLFGFLAGIGLAYAYRKGLPENSSV